MYEPFTTVVETPAYLDKASGLLTEAERAELVETLSSRPDAGRLIQGTGGLRKLRVQSQGRGKRGGARVIYWYHSELYPVVLLWGLRKERGLGLTSDQRKRLARAAEALLDDFGGE